MSSCLTEESTATRLASNEVELLPSETSVPAACPPRVYYGWMMVAIAMLTLVASSPGQTFGISILNEPMRVALGLTHGQLAAAYTLGTLFGALPIVLVGYFMDRFGLRRTLVGAVVLFTLACFAAAGAQGWGTLVVAFFLLRSLGPGALAFLSGNMLAFWFDRRLGMVEGLRTLGMALAMVCIPMFNLWLINVVGWRGAYATLGLLVLVSLLPLAIRYFREGPEEVGQLVDGVRRDGHGGDSLHSHRSTAWGLTLREALASRAFWIVGSGTAMYGAIHTAVFFCLTAIFFERGLTEADAALTLTAYASTFALMQLLGGALADRMPAPMLLAIGMAGLSLSMWVLAHSHTTLHAQLCGMAMGASQGIFFGASQPLWPRYFGRLHLGKIRGVLTTLMVSCSSLGPLFAGTVMDTQGSFDLAIAAFIWAPLPLVVLSLLATPPRVAEAPEAP